MTINVLETIGPYCVTSQDGERLCRLIADDLNAGQDVVLDFDGVRDIISAFLNPAIGSLYGLFSEDDLRTRLRFVGLDDTDAEIIGIVQERAAAFFARDAATQAALQQASMNAVEV